jgi:hypothetical protein
MTDRIGVRPLHGVETVHGTRYRSHNGRWEFVRDPLTRFWLAYLDKDTDPLDNAERLRDLVAVAEREEAAGV